MPRTPTVAAVMDFFIWGAGHGYLGRRRALIFPWVVWTLALVVWNLIGAVITGYSIHCGCDFQTVSVTESYFGYGIAVGVNWGAILAFYLVPTVIIGGILAFDIYRSGRASMGGFSGTSYGQVPYQQPFGSTQMQGAVTATNFCRSCGAANTPGDTFCANCGAPLPGGGAIPRPAANPQVAVGSAKTCSNCGTSNPAQNSFCKRCGTRL